MTSLFLGKPTPIDDTPPTAAQLKAADDVKIQDAKGQWHSFGSLRKDRKTIVIFLRHHFCGMCVEYVAQLSRTPEFVPLAVPRDGASDGKPQLILVSHGDYQGIELYRKTAATDFEMYSDKAKKLYHALGMDRAYLTPGDDESAGAYSKRMPLGQMISLSMKRMLKAGRLGFKGGDSRQLGGEFAFDKDGSLLFLHRMVSTRDHTEPEKLIEVAKLGEAASAPAAAAEVEAEAPAVAAP